MKDLSPETLHEWFVPLVEEALSESEMQDLDAYLAHHPEAIDALADFFILQGILYKRSTSLQVREVETDADALQNLAEATGGGHEDESTVGNSSIDVSQITETERIQFIEQFAQQKLDSFLHQQQLERNAKKQVQFRCTSRDATWLQLKKHTWFIMLNMYRTSIALAAGLILLLTVWGGIQAYLSQRVVAILGSSQQAKWETTPTSSELRPGLLTLNEGCAQLTFRNGAQVLLQAPCQIELKSPKHMRLESGRVTATVSAQARGFTVDTESSRFVDYGTEFGVAVDTVQQALLHVFQGEVGVRNKVSAKQQMVTGGQGVLVDQAGQFLATKGDQAQAFLRDLPDPCYPAIPGKRLDLADLVGGGNGYGTGRINQGIHLGTGQKMMAPIGVQTIPGLKNYHLLPEYPFIDGVFVPNGSEEDVEVTSTGLVWQDCPATIGRYFEGVINGVLSSWQGNIYQGQFNGVEYGTRENPALNLHPNAGITYDLQAVRMASRRKHAVRFTAQCCISDHSLAFGRPINEVRFWVLLDGQVRESIRMSKPGSHMIDLPLDPTHRFLTLATTCSGHIGLCWTFFGEPMLELAHNQ